MKKEDIKNEKMYMQIDTGSVDTGKGWLETISDQEEASEDLHLVEVGKDKDGNWVEA